MKIEEYLGTENQIGVDIWEKKYRFQDETYGQWLDRATNGNVEVKELILKKQFAYAGRIQANRGLHKHGIKVTYSNCYVITPPEDNLESIWNADYKIARTESYGGGVGIDMSNLSPNGARVNNAARTTSGVVSFMEQYAHTTARIAQNGRRGALMLSLSCNHPDLEEFISVKGDLNKIVAANISIRIDDEFLKKVENNEIHTLSFTRPETGEVISKEVNAKDLFMKLAKMNWDMAEPGLLYWDAIKNWTLLSDHEEFEFAGVNPCAEEPLPAGGSCLLSSINLSAFVTNPFTAQAKIDFDGLKKAVDIIVKEMNIVLDEGLPLHPLQEQKDSVAKWRQIGLGIMGIADAFIKMGITYGSYTSLVIADKIGETMIQQAMLTSALLAKEFGAYPGCDKEAVIKSAFFQHNKTEEIEKLVKEYGLRNSQLLTIAPTGSISTLLGISGGVEPLYAKKFTRVTKSLHGHDQAYDIFTPIVKEYMEVTGTPENKLPKFIVTAMNLDYKARIKMQATWQKRVDAAISSTINLNNKTTVEEVFDIYMSAWKNGLKGITIFRDGCSRAPILSQTEDDSAPIAKHDDQHCPDCGSELIASGGCFECPDPECGWGKCTVV